MSTLTQGGDGVPRPEGDQEAVEAADAARVAAGAAAFQIREAMSLGDERAASAFYNVALLRITNGQVLLQTAGLVPSGDSVVDLFAEEAKALIRVSAARERRRHRQAAQGDGPPRTTGVAL